MQSRFRPVTSFVLSAAFAASVMLAGCSARVTSGYRVHDSYQNDDHAWDNNELVFYSRWEGDTHRKHRDFRRRHANEQKDYWTWRHNQH